MSEVWVWRAREGDCARTLLTDPKFDAVLGEGRSPEGKPEQVAATPYAIEEFIAQSAAGIPEQWRREAASERMREGLVADPVNDDTTGLVWRHCATESRKLVRQEFDTGLVATLREAVCDAEDHGAAIGNGVARNWISSLEDRREFSAKLARALLGEDGKACAPSRDYDQQTHRILRGAAGPPPGPAVAPLAAPKYK